MSTIRANTITDSAGTGAPNFTNGLQIAGSAGTVGQVLTSAGSGVAPSWASPSMAYNNCQVFTASGTFNTPAGVTQAFVYVIGGGGAGGSWNSTSGGRGGCGGVGIKAVAVSGAMTVTVGAGGTYSGGAGGTSSFGGISATGGGGGSINGVNGAEGSATGADISTASNSAAMDALFALPVSTAILQAMGKSTQVPTTTTTPLAYTLAGTCYPGANGRGAVSSIAGGAAGGGGAVFIFY